MKNKIIYLSLVTVFIAACSAKDNKAELEELKKQKAEIETKIATLEAAIAKTDTANKEIKVIEITALPVNAQTFKTYIEVQGRVDADENVSLSSELPGTLTKINVKVGEQVSKGQVLAETDTRAIQQQIADLQTSLDFATQVYDKQKKLWDEKIGTEIQFLQAKNTKESLEKKLATLQEQITMSRIISPINGNVDEVNVKIGQAIAPGVPAINVINFNNLKVKAEVAESYSARIKNGNEVQILFPDFNDSIISKVNYASRSINALTRTFNVEVILDNNKEYHPNMVAKLKINDYQSPTPQLIVAEKYIQKGTNESYIMVAENDKAVKKTVTINHQYNGNAEISSGLKEGDLIITDGYDLVNDGDAIKIKQ
jgi:membrane fusion protein (multidrug efflux system)